MRPILLITALLLTLLAPLAPAHAQSEPVGPPAPAGNAPLVDLSPGILLKKNIPQREPNEKELREANRVFEDCTANERESSYYDCQCMSLNFLQQRMNDVRDANDRPTEAYFFLTNARKACPNMAGIAGMAYTRCTAWAPRLYANPEQFCSCYANDYARRFAFNPNPTLRLNQMLMQAAMTECNAGQVVQERMIREQRIEQLKRDGTYETLFPSAEALNKPIIPENSAPATRPGALSRGITDRLFAPDTGPRRTEPSGASAP